MLHVPKQFLPDLDNHKFSHKYLSEYRNTGNYRDNDYNDDKLKFTFCVAVYKKRRKHTIIFQYKLRSKWCLFSCGIR